MGLIPPLTSITGAPVKLEDRFPQSEHLIAAFDNNKVIFLRSQPAANHLLENLELQHHNRFFLLFFFKHDFPLTSNAAHAKPLTLPRAPQSVPGALPRAFHGAMRAP